MILIAVDCTTLQNGSWFLHLMQLMHSHILHSKCILADILYIFFARQYFISLDWNEKSCRGHVTRFSLFVRCAIAKIYNTCSSSSLTSMQFNYFYSMSEPMNLCKQMQHTTTSRSSERQYNDYIFVHIDVLFVMSRTLAGF